MRNKVRTPTFGSDAVTKNYVDNRISALKLASSPVALFYRVDVSSVSASDPGTGKFRYNNVNQTAATFLYMDNITQEGFDATLFLVVNDFKEEFIIHDKNFAINRQRWKITGPAVIMPDWFQVPVQFLLMDGAPFTHNMEVAIILKAMDTPTSMLAKQVTSLKTRVTQLEETKMPPRSEQQRKAMYAAAAGKSTLGIPKSVGKEFTKSDKGGKLPKRKAKRRK